MPRLVPDWGLAVPPLIHVLQQLPYSPMAMLTDRPRLRRSGALAVPRLALRREVVVPLPVGGLGG